MRQTVASGQAKDQTRAEKQSASSGARFRFYLKSFQKIYSEPCSFRVGKFRKLQGIRGCFLEMWDADNFNWIIIALTKGKFLSFEIIEML